MTRPAQIASPSRLSFRYPKQMQIPHGCMAAWAVWIVLSVSGCFRGYTSPINAGAQPENGYAYLYGRFLVDGRDQATGLDGGQRMGLIIECDDGKRYELAFSMNPDEFLQMIRISPATCAPRGMDFDGKERGFEADAEIRKPAFFAQGKAYYLGDYFGTATHSRWEEGYSGRYRWASWKLESATNRYATTTEEMRATYRNFATIPTENQMLMRPFSPGLSD